MKPKPIITIFIIVFSTIFSLNSCKKDFDEENILNLDALNGIILDAESNLPIAGVIVRFLNSDYKDTTDPNGVFSFGEITVEDSRLLLKSDYYSRDTIQINQEQEDTLSIVMELKPRYSWKIQGNIVLENQEEYSNGLAFIAGPHIATLTDSAGLYQFSMWEADSVYTGAATLFFYLEDYWIKTYEIFLENGIPVLDTLDVDANGTLLAENLIQIFQVDFWADDSIYTFGDSIHYTVSITNPSDINIITLEIPITESNGFDFYRHVALYSNSTSCDCSIPDGFQEWTSSIFPQRTTMIIDKVGVIPDSCNLTGNFNFGCPDTGDLFPLPIGVYDLGIYFKPWYSGSNTFQKVLNFVKEDWFTKGFNQRLDGRSNMFPSKFKFHQIEITD